VARARRRGRPPFAYLPDWVVALGERLPGQGARFGTRWNAARNRRARDRLLDVLRAHHRAAPGQRLVLFSGDVHQGAAVAWRWPEGARVYPCVSSPVTNTGRGWKGRIARRLAFSMRHVRHGAERLAIERLGCARPGQRNPVNGLNVGVVYVEDEGARAAVRFELVTYAERAAGTARVAYESGPLSGPPPAAGAVDRREVHLEACVALGAARERGGLPTARRAHGRGDEPTLSRPASCQRGCGAGRWVAGPMREKVSRAHRRRLLPAELPACRRHVLEVVRQPLEDGVTRISSPARPGS
jgi:Magnesium chelatase, subunit ChlI